MLLPNVLVLFPIQDFCIDSIKSFALVQSTIIERSSVLVPLRLRILLAFHVLWHWIRVSCNFNTDLECFVFFCKPLYSFKCGAYHCNTCTLHLSVACDIEIVMHCVLLYPFFGFHLSRKNVSGNVHGPNQFWTLKTHMVYFNRLEQWGFVIVGFHAVIQKANRDKRFQDVQSQRSYNISCQLEAVWISKAGTKYQNYSFLNFFSWLSLQSSLRLSMLQNKILCE